ncbi:MAG: hypothetical protein LUF78_00645 [Clostridiales bacterium]|nr:hypothetical protein [Clostridiales bacterium]
MQYKLNKTNYHTFEIFEVNKLPARSYFIPYPTRAQAEAVAPKEKRYASEKVRCLNGKWDFRFYPKPAELPDTLDTDQTDFSKMDVPACWQFRGYDRPFYVNIRYQFPYKPPVIPTTEKVGRTFAWLGCDQKVSPRFKKPDNEYNFVGVYRHEIEVADPDKRQIISFMGVASCMDLYINGAFVGYSEGSHNIAEFDLSGKLKAGKNEMVVVVHRWCNGTYLESQDMFRNNGIFRDVLLRTEEDTDFWDIDAVTTKNGDTYNLTLRAKTRTDTEVTFTLEGHGIRKARTVATKDQKASVTFKNLDVKEWNAEEPSLYNVYYETATSCVLEKIGFRKVEIQGDVFLLNGRKIKFKGVNHHDTSATNGYTMTPEEIEKDVLLCREFNIDMIRTSHYPPDPLLLELADQLGIYIVDENDLETHGTFAAQLPPTYNSISHNPKWEKHYMDRIIRLYQRDKLHPSIVMWSLGNEAGGYSNMDAMYHYLKKHSDLPVHYESAIHCKREAYDVGSEMYPSVKMVHDVGEKKRKQKRLNNRPYFLCEYAHAMGVGPGNMEAYWQEIYHYDSLFGGCIWEMVDHAVLHEDGTYTYGGDHGEWEHDKNFCVDGIFYPDRRPSTGAWIARYIYRPIRVSHVSGNTYELFNTTAFSDGSRYQLTFKWNDGSESVIVPVVPPLSKTRAEIPCGKEANGEIRAVVVTTDQKTGRVVSEEEVVLTQKLPHAASTGPLPENCTVQANGLQIRLGQDEMIPGTPSTILFRAGTDNDINTLFINTMEPYTSQREETLSLKSTPHGYQVVTRVSNKKNRFTVTDTYEGCEDGVLVTSRIHCNSGRGILPRFGKTFRLPESFDLVEYTGRTGESYADMKEQFPIGDVSCRVTDMTEPNIRPQESGNRCDCTRACVSDGKTKIHFLAVSDTFELGIKPYSDRELIQMAHRQDEKRAGTYVTIQAFQEGIGTGICGPAIAPEYQYPVSKDYELKFIIRVES